MKQTVSKCHCGKPLHYNDPSVRAFVEEIISKQGLFIEVQVVGGKKYLVDRHYIALHGIKAKEIPTLGFKEIKNAS
jgi:hypothetical protein